MVTLTLACQSCREAFASGGGDAAGFAILFMLAVIVPLLGGIGFFMYRVARRSDSQLDPEFQDDFDSSSVQ